MQVFDLHNSSKAVIALANAAITTNTTTEGAIIDTENFRALEFLLQSGTVTDGVYTVTLEEGDDSGLSDASDVSAEEQLGAPVVVAASDDSPFRTGYVGKKRYVRLKIVSTGTTTGVDAFSAMALLSNGMHQPEAAQDA